MTGVRGRGNSGMTIEQLNHSGLRLLESECPPRIGNISGWSRNQGYMDYRCHKRTLPHLASSFEGPVFRKG
jgi:hypothetical protein